MIGKVDLIENLLEEHLFTVNRGFEDYCQLLGDEFKTDIESLVSEDHWIDMGCGAGRAQREFSEHHKAHLTGITFKASDNVQSENSHRMVLSGRKFDEIRDNEISRADVITDVVGILYYTEAFTQTLNRYLELLKTGGRIYVFQPALTTWVHSAEEKKELMLDWLKRQNGIQLTELTTRAAGEYNRSAFKIQKSGDCRIELSELRLAHALHEHALVRVFSQDDTAFKSI